MERSGLGTGRVSALKSQGTESRRAPCRGSDSRTEALGLPGGLSPLDPVFLEGRGPGGRQLLSPGLCQSPAPWHPPWAACSRSVTTRLLGTQGPVWRKVWEREPRQPWSRPVGCESSRGGRQPAMRGAAGAATSCCPTSADVPPPTVALWACGKWQWA